MVEDSQGTGGSPSRTALATARARARHQVADHPRILTDPVVARLVGGTTGDRLGSDVVDRPRRLFFAARARYAEDTVAAAVATGVRQVVILGAGLDTFAYRNPHPGLRVFEVDQAATQEWKRRRLAEVGIDLPETLTFVPLDLETDALATELAAAGFSRDQPAVFVWLGVVYYLAPDAVTATLRYIAGQARPTDVVVDYLRPADTAEDRAQLQERQRRVAAAGEPWFSYFTPADIAARLDALGFTVVEDHSAAHLVDGYVGGSGEFAAETPAALRASRILRARR